MTHAEKWNRIREIEARMCELDAERRRLDAEHTHLILEGMDLTDNGPAQAAVITQDPRFYPR